MNQPPITGSIEEKLKYAEFMYPKDTVYHYHDRPSIGLRISSGSFKVNDRGEVFDVTNSYLLFDGKYWAEVVSKLQQLSEEQIHQDERTKGLNEVMEYIESLDAGNNLYVWNIYHKIKSMLPQPEPDKFEAEAERMMEKNWNELGRIEFKELIVEALKKDPKEI